MGREFASAAARWCHLLEPAARPEIVAVASRSAASFDWFRQQFRRIEQFTQDYRQLLANPRVEAVYMAVPHHLHQEVCCATLEAGKHLMAEKPVGIDLAAFEAIADVRVAASASCSSAAHPSGCSIRPRSRSRN